MNEWMNKTTSWLMNNDQSWADKNNLYFCSLLIKQYIISFFSFIYRSLSPPPSSVLLPPNLPPTPTLYYPSPINPKCPKLQMCQKIFPLIHFPVSSLSLLIGLYKTECIKKWKKQRHFIPTDEGYVWVSMKVLYRFCRYNISTLSFESSSEEKWWRYLCCTIWNLIISECSSFLDQMTRAWNF